MYSIKNLASMNYWFSYVQPLNPLSLWILIAFFSLFVVAAIVISQLAKREQVDKPLRRGLKKIVSCLTWMGIFGLFLVFFRYEMASYFSRRFLLGIWFIGFVIWVVNIVLYFKKDLPKVRQVMEDQQRIKKYL